MLGMAGSGKGTQAKLLAEKYGFKHLSSGEILREEAKKETELGMKLKEMMKKGELVQNGTILEIIKKETGECEGVVFDGFHRTLEQAEEFDELCEINLVIRIEIPDEVEIERLTKRRK